MDRTERDTDESLKGQAVNSLRTRHGNLRPCSLHHIYMLLRRRYRRLYRSTDMQAHLLGLSPFRMDMSAR